MDFYRFSPVSGTLTSAVWPARPTRPRRLEMWSLGWSMFNLDISSMANHFNSETFLFVGRLVYGSSLWYCSNGPVAFSWTQDPALFAALWRFGTRSIFTSRMCQQHSGRWQTGPWPFSSVGYRKSVPAFLAMSFKSCATSLHELWTPLLGRSCRANRPWGAIVWDLELGTDWTGILRHKAWQTVTKSFNPHGVFF